MEIPKTDPFLNQTLKSKAIPSSLSSELNFDTFYSHLLFFLKTFFSLKKNTFTLSPHPKRTPLSPLSLPSPLQTPRAYKIIRHRGHPHRLSFTLHHPCHHPPSRLPFHPPPPLPPLLSQLRQLPHPCRVGLGAAREPHVLDADADAFPQHAAADALVHHDPKPPGGDVPHDPGLPVVELVRHPLPDGGVRDDVDVVPDFNRGERGADPGHPVPAKLFRKQGAGAVAQSPGVYHGGGWVGRKRLRRNKKKTLEGIKKWWGGEKGKSVLGNTQRKKE